LTWAAAADGDGYWPAWRGPLGTGVSPHGDPPVTWSESENIRFKVPVPGRGLASPVVWKDRIFVLSSESADPAAYAESQKAAAEKAERREFPPAVAPVKQRYLVLAFSRADGSLLWKRTAAEKVPSETHHMDGSWASASPLTDGERLYAHFGSAGTFAYDMDGTLLWQVDLGDMQTRAGFGEGSSPAVQGDTLVINWDHEGDSFIVALNARTGKEIWRTERPEEATSWGTPLIVKQGDAYQVVVAATGKSRGYDLKTGEVIWRIGGMTVNTIPSPVQRDGIVYLASGFRGNMLQAISLATAQGDLEESEALLWSYDRDTPYVPSLLLYGDHIYFVKRFGNILSNLDAATGKVHYNETRLPGMTNVYASPVGAADRVFFFGRDGHAVVLKHGSEFEVLAENKLDEGIDATPAIVDGEIYVRGQSHLYCIAEQPEAVAR
jgi:outer membrane protein assembly factor BamB